MGAILVWMFAFDDKCAEGPLGPGWEHPRMYVLLGMVWELALVYLFLRFIFVTAIWRVLICNELEDK
jgi:hypothetical protein